MKYQTFLLSSRSNCEAGALDTNAHKNHKTLLNSILKCVKAWLMLCNVVFVMHESIINLHRSVLVCSCNVVFFLWI
jgi:hypothetical protein